MTSRVMKIDTAEVSWIGWHFWTPVMNRMVKSKAMLELKREHVEQMCVHSVHAQDNYALDSLQRSNDFKYAVHIQLMFVVRSIINRIIVSLNSELVLDSNSWLYYEMRALFYTLYIYYYLFYLFSTHICCCTGQWMKKNIQVFDTSTIIVAILYFCREM